MSVRILVGDVRHALTPGEQERADAFPASFGAAFTWAAKVGLIEPTGQVAPSSRPERRGGVVRVWRRRAA